MSVQEAYRERRGLPIVDALWRDVRYGVRLLRRNPLFAATAILSLGLGIGVNSAIFSIVDPLLLRSLPVRHADRLAIVENGSYTFPIWEELQRHETLFGGAAAWANEEFQIALDGRSQRDSVVFVSGTFFDVLGVRASLGRTFSRSDDRRGGGPDGPVAVISHAYWERRFARDANLAGRTMLIENVPFVIIGVTPQGFSGADVGSSFDVAIPFGTEPLLRGGESQLDKRSTWWLNIVIRRKAAQTLEEATAVLRSIQPLIRDATVPTHYRTQDRERYLSSPLTLVPAARGRSPLRERFREPVLVLMAAAGIVLLVTCINIANLLLARAGTRRGEMSLRLALGASRKRLAGQLLVENLTLSIGGALTGLLFAWWTAQLIVGQFSASDAPVVLDVGIDWRVLLFTAGIAGLSAPLFGIVPALRATNVRPGAALKEQGRSTAGEGHAGAMQPLIVGQVALSLTLVVVAVLLIRTFASLAHQRFGFDTDRLLVANITLARDSVPESGRGAIFERIRQAASAVPNVETAAAAVITPISGAGWNTVVSQIDRRVVGGTERERGTWVNAVSEEFFSTYGTRVLAGREFSSSDRAGSPGVVIVNEAFARRFLGGADPVGHQLQQGGGPGEPLAALQVVGYVADARYHRNLRREVPPTIYLPLAQVEGLSPDVSITVSTRTGEPATLAQPLVAALERVGPQVSVQVVALGTIVANSLVQERALATLAGLFGGLALVIASVGLYGVTAYSVSRRRAEIGIRLALGATPRRVLSLVLGRVALLVGLGIVIGLLFALWAARSAKVLLYGLEPHDPTTLVGAALVLLVTGGVAGALPAWRASRTDPAVALRE